MSVASQPRSDGWQASIDLGFAPRAGRTALVWRRQRGPLAVQRPFYPEAELCHLYLLHPPGGVVGGDSLQIQAHVGQGGGALVTTPGATKFYTSGGAIAQQTQRLQVADGASLEWLPQENIIFPGADIRLLTRVELEPAARFIGWDCQCLGRPAIAERFDAGRVECRLAVSCRGRPLLLERLQVSAERLQGAAGLRGRPVTATLLATPAGETELGLVRELIAGSPNAGVSLLDELLLLRYLGDSTEQCRRLFVPVWTAIREAVIGRPACPPRIWAT
jgi:urease accessory protein